MPDPESLSPPVPPAEPLAAVPEPAVAAKPARAKNPAYVVLRRATLPALNGAETWVELARVKATSRKLAVKEATKALPVAERGGEFAVILESNWATLSREFKQRTVEEDVFA